MLSGASLLQAQELPVLYVPVNISQLGHIRPPAPADLMVFCQRETELEAPVASPSQVAKVLGEV
jgi:hypothetical protein